MSLHLTFRQLSEKYDVCMRLPYLLLLFGYASSTYPTQCKGRAHFAGPSSQRWGRILPLIQCTNVHDLAWTKKDRHHRLPKDTGNEDTPHVALSSSAFLRGSSVAERTRAGLSTVNKHYQRLRDLMRALTEEDNERLEASDALRGNVLPSVCIKAKTVYSSQHTAHVPTILVRGMLTSRSTRFPLTREANARVQLEFRCIARHLRHTFARTQTKLMQDDGKYLFS